MIIRLKGATFTTNIGTLDSWSIKYTTTNGSVTKKSGATSIKKDDTDGEILVFEFDTAKYTYKSGTIVSNGVSAGTISVSGNTITVNVNAGTTLGGKVEINFVMEAIGGEEPEDPVNPPSDPTLDSIAYGGKTYREIFINKNIMPNINNNVLLSNAANTVIYTQYKSEYPATIKQSTAAETNYVPSYYMDVSGAESRYLQRDTTNSSSDGAPATAGEIFFGGVNVKITDWTVGRAGINVGTDYSLAVVDRTTNGYERLTAKITAAKDAGYFIGSTGKASLTGYINNPVLVRGSIFGSNMPSESEWTTLYNNYCEILSNNV
jgi:hypothetical protein